MNRPLQLFIQPFTYYLCPRPDWTLQTGNMGNCVTDSQQIIFDAGLTEQAERDTILHEALHALWAQTHLQKAYTEDQQEEIIWTLTPRLLSLIFDNPEFLKWLRGR